MDAGRRNPLPPLKVMRSSIGASTVVTTVMTITNPNSRRVITPAPRPTPAIMSATSPRGNIPLPMRAAPALLNPKASDGSPAPKSLLTIPTNDSTTANSMISQIGRSPEKSAVKSTCIPVTTKNIGATNRVILEVPLAIRSFRLVADRASPSE